MKLSSLFVTGTDTEVGKTRISVALMKCLQQQGLTTAGMKPIASGCFLQNGQWVNEDALALQQQADIELPYDVINPYHFQPAIAPHIAADQVGEEISLRMIQDSFEQIQQQAEAVVVEGAGGWLVPINQTQTMADLAQTLDLPVVLVVAMKLGCINHALLSVAAIQAKGLSLAGWVANHVSADGETAAMIDSLKQRIDAPCLGVVPYLAEHEDAVDYLKLGEQ